MILTSIIKSFNRLQKVILVNTLFILPLNFFYIIFQHIFISEIS